MKNLTKTLITVVLAGLMTITGSSAYAAAILFGRVSSANYVADGQDLVNYLTAGGNTVNYVDLNASVITDFSPYSQVWVYDLQFSGPSNSAIQNANYANIANWYNSSTAQNLIADGRIISSSERWTDRPNGLGTGGEPEWIQNYATQLDAVGGGLVLGTDHDQFHAGINTINSLININPFTGFYYTAPLQASVDPASDLFISGLESCTNNSSQSCINDNSSTGFAPTGLQPNGQFLTPVAYHGGTANAFELAAVSATFTSPTFPVPEPSVLALMGIGLAGMGFARRRKIKD